MGTFMGHAVTGSFFFAMGYFLLLRAIGARFLDSLRTKDLWLLVWPFLEIIGGLVYSVGEWWFMSGMHMSHMQHFLMAAMFTLAGLGTFLHMIRVLRPLGFGLVGPGQWAVLAILFYIHEQDNRYLKFGHSSIAALFTILFFSQSIELFIGQHTNPSHHIARIAALDYQDRHHGIRSCTNPEYSRIAPCYTNRKVYGTIFPMLSGILLMIIGTWDWDLAFTFNIQKNTREWDELLGMDGTFAAESAFIAHIIANIIVAMVTAIIVKKIDDWCCDSGSLPLAQRDEHILFLSDLDKRPIASSDGEDDQKPFAQYAAAIDMVTTGKLS